MKRKTTTRAAGPTQRQLRVGEELRHGLAAVLSRDPLADPNLKGVPITVSEVRVSPDLRAATAFVMPLGGRHAEGIVAGLRKAAPFLRGLVAREVTLKFMPRLSFERDPSFDEASRINQLLNSERVARDLRLKHDGAAADPDAPLGERESPNGQEGPDGSPA